MRNVVLGAVRKILQTLYIEKFYNTAQLITSTQLITNKVIVNIIDVLQNTSIFQKKHFGKPSY